ncbi:hypothetical protein [Massilia sp. HP4]|uniref:hypothetical protein n=1 Tax=Massilia sp. HP4 TaxID=2562316 RepID=UPI0010C06539|nr:hypothetical protein [Massilia sp. HP4]
MSVRANAQARRHRRTAARDAFLETVCPDDPLDLSCRAFDVSRSGHCVVLDFPASQRAQGDEKPTIAIKAAHVQTRQAHGRLRLRPEPAAQGLKAGRAWIMQARHELGLNCEQKLRFNNDELETPVR